MSIQAEFHHADVEILSDRVVYDGFFKMHALSLRHRLFAGGWSQPFTRELFVRGQAAGVLIYDPKLDSVVLVEQFRVGALSLSQQPAESHSPWLLEIVAGIVEPGEQAEDVAIREAKEESGSDIRQLIPICEYLVSPGGTDESLALFCALADCAQLGGLHGLDDENEDIKVHVVPRSQAYKAVATGRINNAATIIALQWLQLNVDRLAASTPA